MTFRRRLGLWRAQADAKREPAVSAPADRQSQGYGHRRLYFGGPGDACAPSVLCGRAPNPPTAGELDASLRTLWPQSVVQEPTVVFVDCETTGLVAGSLAFVIGIAYLCRESGRRVCVEQWTLERLSSEAAMLRDFEARLGELAPVVLVSYNGASFDLPLLRSRARRGGLVQAAALESSWPQTRGHHDFLTCARRLWKGHLRDCRLQTLERDFLGLGRRGDISGKEMPAVFWGWLRSPNSPHWSSRMAAVRAHNQADLVVMPSLVCLAARRCEQPRDLKEAWGAGRHLVAARRWEAAADLAHPFFEQLTLAVDPAVDPAADLATDLATDLAADPQHYEFGIWVGDVLRRAGKHQMAAQVWQRLCDAFPGEPEAHEELAKFLEHRCRAPERALEVAAASRWPCPRRIERLQKKVAARRDDLRRVV